MWVGIHMMENELNRQWFQINVYIYYTAQSKHSYNIPSIVGVHFEYKTAAKLMTKQLLYTK